MNLFELSQNIGKIDQNKAISDSIKNVNDELNGLTKDRMCKVYSSYVYNELKKNHILARLINTNDLGFDYEHQFILVPINKLTKDYYLIDLTYSQFVKNIEDEKVFTELLNRGYQKINNELWIQYLKNILRNNNVNSSIDEAFNKEINNNKINL